jgi:hypothetical protein
LMKTVLAIQFTTAPPKYWKKSIFAVAIAISDGGRIAWAARIGYKNSAVSINPLTQVKTDHL